MGLKDDDQYLHSPSPTLCLQRVTEEAWLVKEKLRVEVENGQVGDLFRQQNILCAKIVLLCANIWLCAKMVLCA